MNVNMNTLDKIIHKLNQRYYDATIDTNSSFSLDSNGYVWSIKFDGEEVFCSEEYMNETPKEMVDCILSVLLKKTTNTIEFLKSCDNKPLTFEGE